jgi:hypothetical protein
MYALFHEGKQISKAHSTEKAAIVEAYERKIVVSSGFDFPGDKSGHFLPRGYEIREISGAK